MKRLKWLTVVFLRYYRHLGLRVSLYAVLSILIAVTSPVLRDLLGQGAALTMTFDSVLPVLTILATTMLAVSTFSLNIMVSAYRAAAASTTPRAHRVLLEGTTTQSVLATFIGAFVYSLSSIVLYRSGFYTEDAAVVVMGVTIFVVVLVILAMLRWVQHLATLGSVDHSIRAVSSRTADALSDLARAPCLGGRTIEGDTLLPTGSMPLKAPRSGYIRLIDMQSLEDCLPERGAIYIEHRPGSHVLKGQVIAHVAASGLVGRTTPLSDCFTIGDQRIFEQDAAYGLEVMSEIACKALSPGINDSGTAIATIHRISELLADHADKSRNKQAPVFDRVFVVPFDYASVLETVCGPIARDGGARYEVAAPLRRMLAECAASSDGVWAETASDLAEHALAHAQHANMQQDDFNRLQAIPV
jgi:uncharacterized membrane protein